MVATNSSSPRNDEDGHPADAVVQVRNVSRRFGAKLALDDVSLSLPAGTVLGLVGENGAGKTTLIKHILGLLKAQSGTAAFSASIPSPGPCRCCRRLDTCRRSPICPAGCASGS